ncbi:MAG: GNAT family N-acetyltransferase [Bacteroidota bacterium]
MKYSFDYEINKADKYAIEEHLLKCSDSFIPPLETYVEIPRYAEKLEKYADTFEAWYNGSLVSLIACYLNNIENKKGFITNVSTLPLYQGKKISSKLFQELLNFVKDKNFDILSLEVNKLNNHAITFYKKKGFKINSELSTKEAFHMFLNLNIK